jgi:outer membrane protein insertion porin family
MKRIRSVFIMAVVGIVLACAPLQGAELRVSSLGVEGNSHVVAEHILSVVGTKVGEPLNREQLQKDVEAIYGLGFFSFVDIDLRTIAGGAGVTYKVQENPIVESITFSGNEILSDEELLKLVFTLPGNVFNRVFFRHDLDRIQEKYAKEGYPMVKVTDVAMSGGTIDVKIVEPKIGNIVIQGNRKTKTRVIERELKLKSGDPFNAKILRHSLAKLQNKGFFEDVNVGFEPGSAPDVIDLVLTVVEQKTGKIGLSVSHGTESGWSGGLSYSDTNWQGTGQVLEAGFEVGDNEQYWVTYSDPYMDKRYFGWKIGAMRREWEDRYYYRDGVRQLEFDDRMINYYIGAGRKFGRDEKYSWFLTLDWKEYEALNIKNVRFPEAVKELTQGKVFSVIGTVTRDNRDPYLSFPKGDVIDVNVEKALDFLGSDYDYTKYWIQFRYYLPLTGLGDLFDSTFITEDNPIIFATRLRAGFSSGFVPTASLYSLGGSSTLRGYDGGEFEGSEMLLFNAELRIPIQKAFGLVIFYDMGNAWNHPFPRAGQKNTSFDLGDLHDSWGVGVRVKTPFGNFRLDYAEGERESKTHFGFGEMF